MNLLKVSSKSNPGLVAGAIAGVVRQGELPVIQAIGADAVNQAVKAFILSRNFLVNDGIEISFIPSFKEVEDNGNIMTVINFTVNKI